MPHAGVTVEPTTYAMYDGECAGADHSDIATLAAGHGAKTGGLVVSFPRGHERISNQLSLRLCQSCAARLGVALLAEAL